MCPGRRSTLFSALVANAETARLNERRAILRPPSCPVDGSSRLFRPRVGQEAAEQADRRQECAEVVDQRQARPVSQYPEKRRPDAAEAEAQAEEQARHGADAARRQFLRIDDHRREGRRQDEADRDAIDDRADEVRDAAGAA